MINKFMTILLSIALVAVSIVLGMSAANAGNDANTNDPNYWTQPGWTCTKDDHGAQSGGYTMPAPPTGQVWTLLVIKKGAGNIGTENQTFADPVTGQTYTWQGFSDKQDGGWSHIITCSKPAPVAPDTCAPAEDYNGDLPGCGTPPSECGDAGDMNGDLPGCEPTVPAEPTTPTPPVTPVPPTTPPVPSTPTVPDDTTNGGGTTPPVIPTAPKVHPKHRPQAQAVPETGA